MEIRLRTWASVNGDGMRHPRLVAVRVGDDERDTALVPAVVKTCTWGSRPCSRRRSGTVQRYVNAVPSPLCDVEWNGDRARRAPEPSGENVNEAVGCGYVLRCTQA